MKKIMLFTLLMIGLIIPTMAQEVAADGSFIDYFATLASLAAFNVVVSAAIIKLLKEPTALIKQLISVGVALALCTIGWFFKLGIFIDTQWYMIFVYAIGVAFPSNGFYDIIKTLLKLFGVIKKK